MTSVARLLNEADVVGAYGRRVAAVFEAGDPADLNEP